MFNHFSKKIEDRLKDKGIEIEKKVKPIVILIISLLSLSVLLNIIIILLILD